MYEIYTDGAYSSKHNAGGIAVVILKDNKLVYQFSKKYLNTTNNRMELLAVITAIKLLKDLTIPVTLYSDSMYVIGCIIKEWSRKKNLDLWEKFDSLQLPDDITFVHVKGHNGNKWNELCDTLAVEASNLID